MGRYNYVTPTSYLELISSLKLLLGKKRGEILKFKKRYEVGLEKLAFAASQVKKRLYTSCNLSICIISIIGSFNAEGVRRVTA